MYQQLEWEVRVVRCFYNPEDIKVPDDGRIILPDIRNDCKELIFLKQKLKTAFTLFAVT
jgi:hypothetical protein